MAKGTVAQKILRAHIVSGEEKIGSDISIKIDQTLTQDATGTMAYLELEAMKVERVKTELSVSYVDHNTQQSGPENNNDHLYLQTVAAAKGVYFSRPGNGICHQVHLERFGIPGKTLLGSDSHTPTNGGIGMIAIGAGGLDVALAMAGKPFRMSYPKILGVNLTGSLQRFVSAKDIILKVLENLTTKGNVGWIVEYFGEGVKKLTVPERATITNMGAELGVTTSVFPSDEMTLKFLEAQARASIYKEISADSDAGYDRIINIDLSLLEPMAACPSSPDNIRKISELKGIKVDQVIVGSCTNGSYLDIALLSKMLAGKTIHPKVSMSVALGSRQVLEMASRDGLLSPIIASGARILESACGPCIGQGMSPADDSVSLRTFNRNFAGRTGTKNDKAYLVSPASAVASALKGEITDPRSLDIEMPELNVPQQFLINDNMIIDPIPADEASSVEIIRKPTLGEPPVNSELPANLNGKVVIKAGSKITTDHIMPAGKHLKHRSNIPEYSKVVFECFNKEGEPTFAERAKAFKASGYHGIIIADESYGQGSSREHAAICPMYLGIKAVIAVSMERIHTANLINFGIIPLFFSDRTDYEMLEEGDEIYIKDIKSQLKITNHIQASIVRKGEEIYHIVLKHALNEENIRIVLAGGVLNLKQQGVYLMGGNSLGTLFKITTFGESHGKALGVVIDGMPPNIELSESDIQKELDRRKPGTSEIVTSRKESDSVQILSGLLEGKTTGMPLAMVVYNQDQNSGAYDNVKDIFRPGHADYSYFKKYGIRDHRGGGRSSGRETLSRVAAGAAAKKVLAQKNIRINAFVKRAAGIECENFDLSEVENNDMRAPDAKAAALMKEKILQLKSENNSAGGIVECLISGVPAGLGEVVFDKLNADLAKAMISIPSVKGIEFGIGFKCVDMTGIENNDEISSNGFLTNNSGGILGGISTGEDIVFRIAVKPTPSIALEQKTIDINGNDSVCNVYGRHDPCICPRIVPVVEAMSAIIILDHLLKHETLMR